MTGKELLFVLGGAMLAGAGTASVVAMQASNSAEQAVDSAKIDARLERIESVLEKTAESIRRNHGKLSDLGERMTGVEMQAAEAVRTATAKRVGTRTETVLGGEGFEVDVDTGAIDGVGPEQLEEIKAKLHEHMQEGPVRLGHLTGPDGKPIEGHVVRLNGLVDAWKKAAELRKLPETERWEKAQEDLGLDYNQVEELKQAVSARDQAMKDAMVTDRDEETDTGRFLVKRLDPAKVARAQSDYRDAVNKTLRDDEQRKDWRDKGYDRAFGGHGGASAFSVMTIGSYSTSTEKTETDK